MRYLTKYFVAFMAALTCACHSNLQPLNLADFNQNIYPTNRSNGFEINELEDGSAALVNIIKPWQGARDNDHHLLILKDDQPYPKNFSGAIIRGEAKRIITLSSTNIAMLEALGEADRIVGVSGIGYITNETVQQRYRSGKILDIGYGTNLNFEAIVALAPDIVLLYGVSGEEVSVTSKLDELGIQYIYVGDYAEESPLAKCEWSIVIGEICGVRQRAIENFEELQQRYNDIKQQIAEQPLDSLAGKAPNPKVMLNTPYRDVWYMPSSRSYIVQLIEDAGGEYIYGGNVGDTTVSISLESAYQLVSGCDVWLNMGAMVRTREALKSLNPRFADMEVVERGDLYNTTARTTPMGGSDFWESGVMNPDIILKDLAKIFKQPVVADHELYYYERLDE